MRCTRIFHKAKCINCDSNVAPFLEKCVSATKSNVRLQIFMSCYRLCNDALSCSKVVWGRAAFC
jgi:hypothetical protein